LQPPDLPPSLLFPGHTVSLLAFWNPPTTAQVTIESVPPNVAEGKDVLLHVHNLPGNLLCYGWFRGTTIMVNNEIMSYAVHSQEITPGAAHTGRETLFPCCPEHLPGGHRILHPTVPKDKCPD
uniref:Uncharacterized protein n=1 Tax=Suricata suricatta TaxID=37032 RepID=A0A673US06_SURSU